jgi:hypothetical protein
MSDNTCLTLGDVARRLGYHVWQVRRLYERSLLPPAKRIGQYRVVDECDLGIVEKALRAAGYIGERVGA